MPEMSRQHYLKHVADVQPVDDKQRQQAVD